jgi:hypothetical protein
MTPYINEPGVRARLQQPAPGLGRVLDALRNLDVDPPPRGDGKTPLENRSGLPNPPIAFRLHNRPLLQSTGMCAGGCPPCAHFSVRIWRLVKPEAHSLPCRAKLCLSWRAAR